MARKAKPARRKPGSGSIRHKAGRAFPFEAAFPIGHGDYRYDSFQTRPEAEAHLDKLTAERDALDAPRNITEGSQLVRVFFPRWLATKVKLAPHTVETYQYLLELASGEGDLGRYRIDEVSREIAGAMLAYFGRKGYQNVEQMRAVCRQAFEYALDEKYIKSNPFTKAESPTVERRVAIAITEADRQHLLVIGAVEDTPDVPLHILWHFYSRLGMRRGEGMAIRWQDCDLRDIERATITIRQQLTREGSRTVVRRTTKGKEPRVVPCPPDLAGLLLLHKEWQIKRAAQRHDPQIPTYVFTDPKGAPLKTEYVRSRWYKVRTRAGMPADLRIHDLRHTAMTILALGGVPENVRMAIAGHKTAAMAGHYANHASIEDMRRALGA